MNPSIRGIARRDCTAIRGACVLALACVSATLSTAGIAIAHPPQGAIVAWGANEGGQINVPAPNSGFTAVAGGQYHSLGLKADGSIVAWGYNGSGEIDVPAPNTGFVGVAAGLLHSLGLKGDGSIVAWGFNDYGQTNVPAPNTGFVAVAAGLFHSLGLKGDGSIVAWGCGNPWNYGQCNVPAPNADFIGIAAGGNHSLALRGDGAIVAWGCSEVYCDNSGCWCTASALGPPSLNNGFVSVAAGGFHSLARKADGSIVAWGCELRTDYGQCNVPAPNADFIAVAADSSHSLAIRRVVEDADGDGVVDGDDLCLGSDVGETIVIDKCDTGIANEVSDEGCTRADTVAVCAEEARNHGQFVQCVAQLANGWKRSGAITDADRGRIMRCAAQADIPPSDDEQTIGPNRAARRPDRALQRLDTQQPLPLPDKKDGIHEVPGRLGGGS